LVDPDRFTVISVKLGSVLANFASIAGFAFYIADRTSSLPSVSGPEALNHVIHLALLSAILYGVLWALAELLFGWDYGAGGGDMEPSGPSAVALSLSMTLPLAFVPFLYSSIAKIPVIHRSHWRAMLIVVFLGAGAHLMMYGTKSRRPNGLRHWIMPSRHNPSFRNALLMELISSLTYFSFIVLPYRLIVDPSEPLRELLLGRTLLSCSTFFFGMTVFIALKYPGSLRDRSWIQVRGILGGLLLMFCLCGGMFF
jgi:hypothetical protein